MARDKIIMRIVLPSVVALLAVTWANQAMAQQVVYDRYGNPIVVAAPVVVVAPFVVAAPYVGAAYLGPASVAGSARRVSRRTSRRTSRRRR